jgi:hypothetical protein
MNISSVINHKKDNKKKRNKLSLRKKETKNDLIYILNLSLLSKYYLINYDIIRKLMIYQNISTQNGFKLSFT